MIDSKSSSTPQVPDFHWADEAATRIMQAGQRKEGHYTVASGITPSGTVHIGNFREVMTVDLVKRALEHRGQKVRFLFSWDDFDVFRKIPSNMPQQEMLRKYLGKSIITVPDPFGKETSYARHHEIQFEESLSRVGVNPEFIYQNEKYRRSDYAAEIRVTLEKKEVIAAILNAHRREPLGDDWYPVLVFCSGCGGDDTKIVEADQEKISYTCDQCQKNETVTISNADNLKLPWRVDWPMRWEYEGVDFEPGGKDHSSEGGSFDTAKEIVKQVYGGKPPTYIPYNFITIKGKGGKMSSSSGEVITLNEVLEVYTPEIVRWFFSSYRNNVEFSLSFDLDVIKNYEAFDRLERVYYGLEKVSEKNLPKMRRIYEFSQISPRLKDIPTEIPYQPAFRHLTNLIQIHDFSLERVLEEYQKFFRNEVDKKKFINRFHCACNWIKKYAPEDFIFSLNREKNTEILANYEEKYRKAVEKFGFLFRSDFFRLEEQEITDTIYSLVDDFQLDSKVFFEVVYLLLIGKKKGPRLAHFLKIIGKSKVEIIL